MTQVNPLITQLRLQMEAFDINPTMLNPEERADFFIFNQLALIHELAEAGNEIGWKPWATSRAIRKEEYIGEMVDAFHFFLNLLLISGVSWDRFLQMYLAKTDVNRKRQIDSYDGFSTKCPFCKRDVPTTPSLHISRSDGNIWCTNASRLVSGAPVETPVANPKRSGADVVTHTDSTHSKKPVVRRTIDPFAECNCDYVPFSNPHHRQECSIYKENA